MSIGTKHGVNFSQITFEPPVDQSYKLGYTGGLVIKYQSDKHAGVQAEFNFSQRGWSESLDSGKAYSRTLNYFEIPVLSHFVFGRKNSKIIINLGPNLSFYTSQKEEMKALQSYDMQLYYQRKPDREFELGLTGGLGYLQKTILGDFQLEGRFHYGLQSVFNNDLSTDLGKSQSLLYSVTLTYFFVVKDFKKGKKNEKVINQKLD
ncbi:MAG: PorT family protein [Bacteroidetes bacterium]|nr:PorT family protein [Bacteroidota bacterium]